MRRAAGVLTVLGAMLAGACAFFPAALYSAEQGAEAYISGDLPPVTAAADTPGGAAQKFVPNADIPAQWWTLFRSPELDLTLRAALANNPTLVAAEASLREARENYQARCGSRDHPEVTAGLSSSRLKSSPAAAGLPDGTKGSVYDLYSASVNVAYTFDVFGRGRRELEELKAQVDLRQFQLEAAYLALCANVVTTAIREAALREELAAMKDILASREKHLGMLEQQLALGGAARAEVLAQRAELEQSRSALPPIEKELAQARHQLAALSGQFPGQEATLSRFTLASITLPEDLPLTLPSALVRQRPDIRAAEALVQAAAARAGIAAADLYPQIMLSGSYGPQAGSFANLFDAGNVVWNIGAGLTQPLFNGGKLRAKKRAAAAALEAASAQFRETVLWAYANVADTLRALETDARALKAQADAESAAGASLEMTRRQLEAGAVNYILLLNAQRQYQQARIGLIRARAQRLSDTAALFQALGGGWWERTDATAARN